ncbi:MAG: hypothetical protein HC857_14525, partial [Synechococcales cyanobacterium RU_4_20]|nr:hypothetical protein [Synechococcales cyanobacterium RU_4_20]
MRRIKSVAIHAQIQGSTQGKMIRSKASVLGAALGWMILQGLSGAAIAQTLEGKTPDPTQQVAPQLEAAQTPPVNPTTPAQAPVTPSGTEPSAEPSAAPAARDKTIPKATQAAAESGISYSQLLQDIDA